MEERFTCQYCGYKSFGIYSAGEHRKAVCDNCEKTMSQDGYPFYLKYTEDLCYDEDATEAQIKGIRYRAYSYDNCLSKEEASAIITIFENAKKRNEYKGS